MRPRTAELRAHWDAIARRRPAKAQRLAWEALAEESGVDPETNSGRPWKVGVEVVEKAQFAGLPEEWDVSVRPLAAQADRATARLADGRVRCAVCAKAVVVGDADAVVCPRDGCEMVACLRCLGQRFLKEEAEEVRKRKGAVVREELLPRYGTCPRCRKVLDWEELVRELGVRRSAYTSRKRRNKGGGKKTKSDTLDEGIVGRNLEFIGDEEDSEDDSALPETSFVHEGPTDGEFLDIEDFLSSPMLPKDSHPPQVTLHHEPTVIPDSEDDGSELSWI